MFPRRTYTIVIATIDRVARIDLLAGKSLEVVHSSRSARPAHAELSDAVRTGLCQGPAKCGRLIVLCDELWSGYVSLANEVVAAVNEAQLEQSLALEAECTSGISPFGSHLAHVRTSTGGEQTTWWVTQIESTQLNAIATAIPTWAGRLEGIASTAISHSQLSTDEGAQRSEDGPESFEGLAKAWMTTYLADRRLLPVVKADRQYGTDKQQLRLGILTAVAAFAVCVAAELSGPGKVESAKAELAQLVDLEKQLHQELQEGERIAQQQRELKDQHAAIEMANAQQLDELRRQDAENTAVRKRPVQLLTALAATTDPGHWIQNIEMRGAAVLISGVAIDSNSVATLAQRLESQLTSPRWQIQPAKLSIADPERLFRFELMLVQSKQLDAPASLASRGTVHER